MALSVRKGGSRHAGQAAPPHKNIHSGNKIRTRVFSPKFGYLEDPATGSGNSAMGYYMLKHDMWDGSPVNIEQNGLREERNIVKLRYDDGAVYFGGSATLRIEGMYLLEE